MSYDYIILRTTRVVSCLNDLGDGGVVHSSWLDEGFEILESVSPGIVWSRESETNISGDGNALGLGRLDFSLSHDHGCTFLMVFGSHKYDQKEFVKRLAGSLDALAFDSQTGQVL